MLVVRIIILLVLTGLQIYFCWLNGKWVEMPAEMWIVGVMCGGDKAIDILSRIRLMGTPDAKLP